MNCIIRITVLALTVQLINSIELNFRQIYYTGVKKIEIPSCKVEPCVLKKGVPLNAKITFDATLPESANNLKNITDGYIDVNTPYFRDLYSYTLGEIKSLCAETPLRQIDCPIVEGKLYTVEIVLYITTDEEHGPVEVTEWNRPAYRIVFWRIGMNTLNGGSIIGNAGTKIYIE